MDVFDLFARISIDLSDFERGLNDASSKFKSFSNNLSKAGSGMKDLLSPVVDGFKAVEGVGQKAGSAIKKGLTGFAAASTAVGGFGAAAVKSGMAFDSSMSKVSAISGATGQDFQDLRDKALEMGAKTKFSASEAADAMTYMGMAGWKTEDMLGGIAGIMNLAAASGEDLASTSDIVTNALTAFGMKASESGHFADILAAASSNANTDVHMMGESFKYAAPVMGTLGYSAEDTAVALGLMGNAGIQASMAGTSLKTALLNMASPTKNMAAVMSQYGISLTDTNGEMYSLGEVMAQLRDKMGGLDETTKAAAASTLFGKEAAAGMLAIINAAPEDFDKLTASINECNGVAEKMSSIMEDNLQGDITKLGSAFESLQIAISDSLTPTLREFAQFGQKAMAGLLEGFQGGGVTGFMSALSGIVTEGVTILAAKAPEFASISVQFVTALADGILGAGPSILNSLYEVIQVLIVGANAWLSSNSTALANFGLDIIGRILGGFQRAGNVISRYIGDFVPAIAEAFLAYHYALFEVGLNILGAIGQGIVDNKDRIQFIASGTITDMVLALKENAPAIIEGGLALLEALVGAIEENLPLILETGGEIVGRLIEGISEASPGVQAIIATAILPFIGKIIDVIGNIGGAVQNAWGLIKKVIDLVSGGEGIEKIIAIGKKLMGGIQALFTLIMAHPVIAVITAIIAALVLLWTNCEEFRDIVKGVLEAVGGFFKSAYEVITGAFAGAVEFFGGIVDGIKGVFEGIGEFLGGLFQAAWELIQAAWGAAVEFFSTIWSGIEAVFSVVADVLGGFFSAAWDAIKAVWDTVVGVFQSIADGIHAAFEAVTSFLGDAFSAAWDLISGVWDAAVEFFSGVWEGITGVFGAVAEWFGDMFSKAWDAVTSAWDGAMDFFHGIWEDITGVFANAWDAFKSIGGNILEGLWNGISDKIAWLKSKVTGIIDLIKGWFVGKDGFDEHSPSKWSRQVFRYVMDGGAEGLDDGTGNLMREISSITDRVKNGLDFGTATVGLNVAGRAAGNAYNASYGQPVSQGGDTFIFNSPKALDPVSAAREMKKAKQQMALGYV